MSFNNNPIEAARLRLYDSNDQLIGEQADSKAVNFLGVTFDIPFAYASVINLQPEDGVFAIDNLRFAPTVPVPCALAAGLIGLALVTARQGRQT